MITKKPIDPIKAKRLTNTLSAIKLNKSEEGTNVNKNKGIIDGSNHPPKNKITKTTEEKIILIYSPKKYKANIIAEYSTLYPATNSPSASTRSNGVRFNSANEQIKKTINAGNKLKIFQTLY